MRHNNKGLSLVELIIVIAIMSVLTGVVSFGISNIFNTKVTQCADNMENIMIYVRGHNLYDIFYGRYKGDKENTILKAYIDAAPKGNFEDIFTAIDRFVYFNNRKNS